MILQCCDGRLHENEEEEENEEDRVFQLPIGVRARVTSIMISCEASGSYKVRKAHRVQKLLTCVAPKIAYCSDCQERYSRRH